MNQLPVPQVKYPTAIDLHRELNQLKKSSLSWMYGVSKCAPQEALRDLDKGYASLFRKQTKHPRFKSRRRGVGSFRLTGAIRVEAGVVQLPRLGRIRLKEKNYLPCDAKVLSATVSEKAGHWFVSLQVEEAISVPENTNPTVGIDLCVGNKLAHCSDGVIIENPRAYRRFERKKKRLNREVSRKKKGSNNRRKAVRKLGKLEYRIANVRKDATHKATTMLTRTKSVIGMEDLAVANMLKNPRLAKSISDAGVGEFYRQIQYKSEWYGSRLVTADRFFPSSKLCSNCGKVHADLKLSDRVFKCPSCNFLIDRDLNASINLERLAVSSTENGNACLSREVHFPAMEEVLGNDAGNECQGDYNVLFG